MEHTDMEKEKSPEKIKNMQMYTNKRKNQILGRENKNR